MKNLFKILILLLFFSLTALSQNSFKDPVVKQLPTITVSIEIVDLGMVNLNLNISIISEKEGKVVKSSRFKRFMTDVELEIRGKVVDVILAKSKIRNSQLHELKMEIDKQISTIIASKKGVYLENKEILIGCKITNFYCSTLNTQILKNTPRNSWY